MNERATRMQQRLEVPMLVAAVLTLPFAVFQYRSGNGTLHTIGYIGGIVVWAAFVVEAVLMLAVVDSRWQWLRHHPLDLVIIVLTPPFLLSNLQGLRILRLLRLLRLFRLAPYVRKLFTLNGLRYVAFLTLMVLLLSAEAFHSAENIPYGLALYWALTTMTTVGYGDVTPHTTAGRIVACVVMVVGVGFFAVLTGAIAQQFLSAEISELEEGEQDLVTRIRRISDELQSLEEQAIRQAQRRTPSPPPGTQT